MYFVARDKKNSENVYFSNICELEKLDSFLMPSKAGGFSIAGQKITDVRIFNVIFARPMVTKVVNNKYKKLIAAVTELLISDDDSGDSFRLALTQIEKFRQEIKNKYRVFLEQKELNLMAKQLSTLQKEAKNRFAELQSSLAMSNTNGKSR